MATMAWPEAHFRRSRPSTYLRSHFLTEVNLRGELHGVIHFGVDGVVREAAVEENEPMQTNLLRAAQLEFLKVLDEVEPIRTEIP